MAKDKKQNLNKVNLGDLKNRKQDKKSDIKNLQKEKKQADTPEERKAIQEQINAKQGKLEKLQGVIDKKEFKTPGGEGDPLLKYYNSDEFLMLSPEMQQMIRQTVENFDPSQFKDIQLTKKQRNLAYQDALNAAKKQFKGDKSKLDMDYEQSLRADIGDMERLLDLQKQQLQTDDQVTADQRLITIRQLQDALAESKSQYDIEANRKNEYLQNQLSDIQYKLDTETGRANEDKVMQLRQLERTYNRQLRETQDNMAQRGLAFSGIRARAEDELDAEFEDYMTTAEIEANRRVEDAQKLAETSTRDVTTMTNQELQNLLYKYGVAQRTSIQGAEGIIGTGETQGLVGQQYALSGQDPNQYIIGGLTGSVNAQKKQSQINAQNNTSNTAALFEQKYGTDLYNKNFGPGYGAMDGYAGYQPTTGLAGTDTTQYNRNADILRQQKKYNTKQGTNLNKSKYLLGNVF